MQFLRWSSCVLPLVLISVPGPQTNPPVSAQTPEQELNGTYEFVSEKADLTEPAVETHERSAPQWRGRWQFQNGYYSSIITETGREKRWAESPRGALGVFAYAGTYQIVHEKLILTPDYAVSLLEVGRSRLMTFSRHGNQLILTEKLEPYVESFGKGVDVTVLNKIR